MPTVTAGRAEVRIERAECAGGVSRAGFTVTRALTCTLRSATLTAVTITVLRIGTVGAVNRPLAETIPSEADQVTAVSLEFRTVTENCCAPFEVNVALLGEIERLAGEGVLVGVLVRPVANPQDVVNAARQMSKPARMKQNTRGWATVNFCDTA